MDDVLSAISKQGWAQLSWWDGCTAEALNARYPEIFSRHPLSRTNQILRPLSQADAKPGTMSSFTGLDRQLPHTDKAHYGLPPRYVVLRCHSAGNASCPTELCMPDWKLLKANPPALLTKPKWLIRQSGRTHFYGRVIEFAPNGEDRLRFDPLCMSLPGEPDGQEEALNVLLAHATISLHEWRLGETLLIDNWRALHARSRSTEASSTRALLRWISGDCGGLGYRDAKSKGKPLWAAST